MGVGGEVEGRMEREEELGRTAVLMAVDQVLYSNTSQPPFSSLSNTSLPPFHQLLNNLPTPSHQLLKHLPTPSHKHLPTPSPPRC